MIPLIFKRESKGSIIKGASVELNPNGWNQRGQLRFENSQRSDWFLILKRTINMKNYCDVDPSILCSEKRSIPDFPLSHSPVNMS